MNTNKSSDFFASNIFYIKQQVKLCFSVSINDGTSPVGTVMSLFWPRNLPIKKKKQKKHQTHEKYFSHLGRFLDQEM